MPQEQVSDSLEVKEPITDETQLSRQIVTIIDEQQLWRDPNYTVAKLSKAVYSNKTYVTRCFRDQLHTSFNDYINRCRIDFVVSELQRNPNQSIEHLFYEVGYHHYTTGWRNFKRIVGISPSDYVDKLSVSDHTNHFSNHTPL